MKKRSRHYPGFRTILLSFNLGTIVIVMTVILVFFAGLYKIIYDMQDRIQQYILLNQLSTEIKNAEYQFTFFFNEYREKSVNPLTAEDEAQLTALWENTYSIRNQAMKTAAQLESNYDRSPQKYFLNRGIIFGLEFINKTCNELLNDNFSIDTESYKKYYQIIKVFSYIENYSSNLYLTAAVKNDVSALIKNIYLTEVFKRASICIFSLIIIISIFSTLQITKTLGKNIQEMLQEAENITKTHFSTEPLKLYGPRELIHLRDKINIMKDSIRERMELEKKVHAQELEHERITRELEAARYRALQAQINPHFLFNALNVTSHTALFERAGQTVKLINSLASLFRYSLEFKNETSIFDELSFVTRYLEIQKARFGQRLSYSVDCPKNLEKIKIPPFTIEPLVENAVIHGIEPKENGGAVRITVKQSYEHKIQIEIQDDGCGISEDFMVYNIQKPENSDKKKHIGISNVIKRIKMFYKDAQISFRRISEDGGTLISIEFEPYSDSDAIENRMEEKDEHDNFNC